jgi:periplasmic protein CpxP/Spy
MSYTRQHTRGNTKNMMPLSRILGLCMLTVALSLSGGAVWAGDHGKGHDPEYYLEKLTEKLSLTQEQQDKILPIMEEKHQKMKDMREQAMGQIEALLTPEQQEKWKTMLEERKQKMKEYKEKHGKKCDKKDKHGMGEKHE